MKGKDFGLLLLSLLLLIFILEKVGYISYMNEKEPKEKVETKTIITPVTGGDSSHKIPEPKPLKPTIQYIDRWHKGEVVKVPQPYPVQDPYAVPDTVKVNADCPPAPYNTYSDKIPLDTLGWIILDDTVQGELKARGFRFSINKFETTTTITKTEKPRRTLYLGGGGFFVGRKDTARFVGELGLKGNIIYQNKKGQEFILSPGRVRGEWYLEFSTAFPIRTRKNR